MVKQMVENTTAQESDWLIGEGCLMPEVKGVALRNMKAPGTAYNDPKLVSHFSSSLDPVSVFRNGRYKYGSEIEASYRTCNF